MKKAYVFLSNALLLISLIFVPTNLLNAQIKTYKNGQGQGVVKVKFKPEMTSTLSKMEVQLRKGILSTGVTTLDNVNKTVKANKMERLIPYDAKHENKYRKHGLDLWYVIHFDESTDVNTAASIYSQLDAIDVVEPIYEKIVTPRTVVRYQREAYETKAALPFDDPLLSSQWHYSNTFNSKFPDGAHVNILGVWPEVAGRSDIIVAVQDNGMDLNHEDLKANLWVNKAEANGVAGADDDGNLYTDDVHGWNFTDNSPNLDVSNHGTHVAGTVAAVNNNGVGVSGVAGGTGKDDGARIMALQVVGRTTMAGAVENAFIYAANNGAVISQNSWGYSRRGSYEQSVLDAIDYFIENAGSAPGSPMKGGLVIFAAGNDNLDGKWYPGCYDRTLSVAALGPNWKKASYSNYDTWVDISAPGGDMRVHGTSYGVLSTIPGNEYGYLDGTSMACPHVSGIAALIIASSGGTVTNDAVWQKLVDGVFTDVSLDEINPTYVGKLGVGSIDADRAVSVNIQLAPDRIADLKLTGISKNMALLDWTVPADGDDGHAASFRLFYSTTAITEENIANANYVSSNNSDPAGTPVELEVADLEADTKYWFAVVSYDRWGNASRMSNVIEGMTNVLPIISAETANTPESVEQAVDVRVSPLGTSTFKVLNSGEGILRWNSVIRDISFISDGSDYARRTVLPKTKMHIRPNLKSEKVEVTTVVEGEYDQISTYASLPKEKKYADRPSIYIGDEESGVPNSSGTRFFVSEEEGFNITSIKHFVQYKSSLKSLVVEIYKGETINEAKLVYDQEYPMLGDFSSAEAKEFVFDEQVFIEAESYFWVVLHVPGGQAYPLAVGSTLDPSNTENCYYSNDLGQSWMSLADASETFADKVWVAAAVSKNDAVGKYLTLTPESGYVIGTDSGTANSKELTLNSSVGALANGTYKSSITFESNDLNTPKYKVPVTIKVIGQKPELVYPAYVDFGNVFAGLTKTIDVKIENIGLGRMNSVDISVDNPMFIIESRPYSFDVQSSSTVKLKFAPTTSGTHNAILTIKNANYTYEIPLVGIGSEVPKISINPLEQTVEVPLIGDKVTAEIEVENIGKYPLQYFIPGYDDKGISEDWSLAFPAYGYAKRLSTDDENPLTYEFRDISTTGVNIKDQTKNYRYATVDIGFDFPFYNEVHDTLYVASNGFVVFDDAVRPSNAPIPGSVTQPSGMIAIFGERLTYDEQSGIYYKIEPDRLIVQYDKAGHSGNYKVTAQMVLFSNGDIRFYYENVTGTEHYLDYINVFMEDMEKEDAVSIRLNGDGINFPASGVAFGFDYPGPATIESITNGSATLSPGKKEVIKVNLKTDDLIEGITKRYINIVSNDPEALSTNSLINIDVKSGGVASFVVTPSEVDFGVIYKDLEFTEVFKIRNTGNKAASIVSTSFANEKFTVEGDNTIEPRLSKEYALKAKTDELGVFTDKLTIKFSDNTELVVDIKSNVLPAPIVTISEALLEETLTKGERKSHDFTISNTGGSDLVFSTIRTPWSRFEKAQTNQSKVTEYNYRYEEYSTFEDAPFRWIDITETGTQAPDLLVDVPSLAWSWLTLDLPFGFNFYGKGYNKMHISGNGIVAFGDVPALQFSPGSLPTKDKGTYIMPFWFSAFNNPSPKGAAGLFHQSFNSADMSDANTSNHDMYVISWIDMISASGVGQAGYSMDLLLAIYKSGDIQIMMKLRDDKGDDIISHRGVVAIQEGEKLLSISEYTGFNIGKGKVFFITPNDTYTLPAGEKMEGEITFDSSPVNAGVYEGAVIIASNDPLAQRKEKPLKLTVNGDLAFEYPEVIDFGERENGLGGTTLTHELRVEIKNTGSEVLELDNMERAGTNMGQFAFEVLYRAEDKTYWTWTNIATLYGPPFPRPKPNPVFRVIPGEVFVVKVILTAAEVGEYEAIFNLRANGSMLEIPVKASVFSTPLINLDKEGIDVFVTEKDVLTEILEISNTGGKDLKYTTSIKYNRKAPSARAVPSEMIAPKSNGSIEIKSIADEVVTRDVTPSVGEDMLTTMAHDGATELTHFDGYTDGLAKNVTATRYKAGEKGFNLTDVFTIFRTEDVKEGVIELEVRIGSDVNAAASVGKTILEFKSEAEDMTGNWYQLTLKEPIPIYPGEEFFVIFTYPQAILRPQGVAIDKVEPLANTYLTYYEGVWFDLQKSPAYGNGGLCMMVGERDALKMGWIDIKSNSEGTVPVDGAIQIEVELKPEEAAPGVQSATILIESNDSSNPLVKVPVVLRVNQAPVFNNAPKAIYLYEDTVDVSEMTVSDNEGNSFTVASVSLPSFTTFEYDESLAKVVLTSKPKAGQTGDYKAVLKATDEYGEATELEIPIEVAVANRAPVYISDIERITLLQMAAPLQLDINALFADPDGDRLSFVVESADETILSASKFGANYILLGGQAVGETVLNIVVSDPAGLTTSKALPVSVVQCTDPYDIISQKWNSVLLVNNTDDKYKAYQWYKDGLLLAGETKQYYAAQELDFDAEYSVQLITREGDVVHTCPYIPEYRESGGLRVYPNIVEAGQTVTIEVDVENLVNDPMNVRVVDMNGNVVQKFTMSTKATKMNAPDASGVYLLVFESEEDSKTFKLVVQ